MVLTTIGSAEEAVSIARAIVSERLAACVNIVPKLRSIYHWQNQLCDEEEQLLLMKTTEAQIDRLIARIQELHSYDLPEVIALPINAGSQKYLRWIEENVAVSGTSV